MLYYWQQYIKIISHPYLCPLFEILTYRIFIRYDVSHYISSFFGRQEIYRINTLWDERPAILKLNPDDEKHGKHILNKLGIAENQWFVCLHVREGGYLPHNELIQSHRNASVKNTFLAIQEIHSRGGIVVRMGDPSMVPLDLDGVVDYAHHPLKSARMDLILCAKAKFFLGCTSGLSLLSMIFGVPVAQANMIPFETLGVRSVDISIPKLLKNNTQNYMSFKEIIETGVSGYFFTHQYKEKGIEIEENTAEDILALTVEMLDTLDGRFIEDKGTSALHLLYMSLFKPTHYSYGATSKVCRAFILKYKNLLEK